MSLALDAAQRIAKITALAVLGALLWNIAGRFIPHLVVQALGEMGFAHGMSLPVIAEIPHILILIVLLIGSISALIFFLIHRRGLRSADSEKDPA